MAAPFTAAAMDRVRDEMWPNGSARERAMADHERYLDIVQKLDAGEAPDNIPWGDHRFQSMLLAAISKWLTYKRDAEKLAVIRDVFGSR